MTVESLQSTPREVHPRGREERKHENSPAMNDKTLDLDLSQDPNQFQGRHFEREDADPYDNYQSIRYGDNSLQDNFSPHFKPNCQKVEYSEFHEGSNVTDVVDSVLTSEENQRKHIRMTGGQGHPDSNDYTQDDYSEGYEDEESENEDTEYNQSKFGYMRRTDGSTDENHSLAEHTRTQFIDNKDLTGGIFHKQSMGENTIERHQMSDSQYEAFNSDEEYESEEEEEESDINIESQISGYDSLSQTHKSKVSSKKFKRSRRFNRNSKTRMTGNFPKAQIVSSQFNDTDSAEKHPEGSESIGIKTRNDRNDETLS